MGGPGLYESAADQLVAILREAYAPIPVMPPWLRGPESMRPPWWLEGPRPSAADICGIEIIQTGPSPWQPPGL